MCLVLRQPSALFRQPCCPAKAKAHQDASRAFSLAATVRSTIDSAPMSVAALHESGCAQLRDGAAAFHWRPQKTGNGMVIQGVWLTLRAPDR